MELISHQLDDLMDHQGQDCEYNVEVFHPEVRQAYHDSEMVSLWGELYYLCDEFSIKIKFVIKPTEG